MRRNKTYIAGPFLLAGCRLAGVGALTGVSRIAQCATSDASHVAAEAPPAVPGATTLPAAAAPPSAPPPATVNPAQAALVAKLGDDDPAVREEATRQLSQAGKSALPLLQAAAEGDDPEVRARAKELIHHIERHLPPPAPAPKTGIRAQSVRVMTNQSGKTIDVQDNGRKIFIHQQPDGSIEMSVTGEEGGKEATETYKARDAAELKRDNPEAFAIYDQWTGGGSVTIRHRMPMNMMPFPAPNATGAAPGVVPAVPPNLPQIRAQMEQQIRQSGIPAEQQEEIIARIHANEAEGRRASEQAEQKTHERLRGPAADGAGKANNPPDEKPSEKPVEKPQTQP